MSKGYYIFLLIFCFTFESYAQNSLVKTVRDTVKSASQLLETVQSTHEKADSSISSLRKGEMIPSSKWVTDFNGDSLLSSTLLRDKFSRQEGDSLTDFSQYFKGVFSFDSIPERVIEKLTGDTPVNEQKKDSHFKGNETFQKAFHSAPAKADSSKSILRKGEILPISNSVRGIKGDPLSSNELVSDMIPPIEEVKMSSVTQYFDDGFSFDSLSGDFFEKLTADSLFNGQMMDFRFKDKETFQKAFQSTLEKADSSKSFLRKGEILPTSNPMEDFKGDSLLSNALLKDKFSLLEGDSMTDFSQYFKRGFSFDSIPTAVLERFSSDSLFGGFVQDIPWKDKDQFQKGLESQFTKELDGEMVPIKGVKQKQAIAKRVISIKDREIVDSIRSLASDKLYKISEDVQDSLSMYLVSEKRKLKENLFFEGLVSMEKYKDNVSVSDFSGSLGVRLNDLYEMGLGPEIGVSGKDFSAIGARLFARRKIFEDKLFVIVENSFRRYPDFSEVVTKTEGLSSNLKLGAGRLFNLSPNGETKLNIQTLLNPQSLKGGYNNVIDFRLGISKLSRK